MIETPAGATSVLVVDDEPNIADLVSMALRYEGFDVAWRATGGRRSTPSRASPPTSSCST